jgi:hypothetical protein
MPVGLPPIAFIVSNDHFDAEAAAILIQRTRCKGRARHGHWNQPNAMADSTSCVVIYRA